MNLAMQLIPEWRSLVWSLAVIVLFVAGILALGRSSYGDWVRRFYERRDRLQTLLGDEGKHDPIKKN